MSTDQSGIHIFHIILRYVSSLLWRLGVAPVSSADGRVFLIKHIAFILTGNDDPLSIGYIDGYMR